MMRLQKFGLYINYHWTILVKQIMVWKIERKLAKMTSFTYRSSSYLFYGPEFVWLKAGSLKMNTALEYSTRVVQEGGRRCKKSTLNVLVHLTPLRIPLMNPP
jgi:hypothetical protein